MVPSCVFLWLLISISFGSQAPKVGWINLLSSCYSRSPLGLHNVLLLLRYIFNPSYLMSPQVPPLQCCKANHLNQFHILHRVEAKCIYMLKLWKRCYFTYFTVSSVVFIICFPLSTTAGKSVLHVAMCSPLLISPAWDSTVCVFLPFYLQLS